MLSKSTFARDKVVKTLYKRDGDPVFHLILHPNGDSFFLTHGPTITHHSLATGEELARFSLLDEDLEIPPADRYLYSMDVDDDGRHLYGATLMGPVWRWDLATNERERILDLSSDTREQGQFSRLIPGGRRLLRQEWKPEQARQRADAVELSVWDLGSKEMVQSLSVNVPWKGGTFSPDGRYLITVERAPAVARVWDLETSALEVVVKPPGRGRAAAGAMSHDHRFLLTATILPAELQLWEMPTATVGRPLYRPGE